MGGAPQRWELGRALCSGAPAVPAAAAAAAAPCHHRHARLLNPPLQGLDEPKLVFQVLPARLRARQYDDLPTTGRTHSGSAHNSARLGSMGGSSGRTLASGGLSIRRAASDWVSAEGTPRQVGLGWAHPGG